MVQRPLCLTSSNLPLECPKVRPPFNLGISGQSKCPHRARGVALPSLVLKCCTCVFHGRTYDTLGPAPYRSVKCGRIHSSEQGCSAKTTTPMNASVPQSAPPPHPSCVPTVSVSVSVWPAQGPDVADGRPRLGGDLSIAGYVLGPAMVCQSGQRVSASQPMGAVTSRGGGGCSAEGKGGGGALLVWVGPPGMCGSGCAHL